MRVNVKTVVKAANGSQITESGQLVVNVIIVHYNTKLDIMFSIKLMVYES